MHLDSFAYQYMPCLLVEAESESLGQRFEFVRTKVTGELSQLRSAIARVGCLATPNTFRGLLVSIMGPLYRIPQTDPTSRELARCRQIWKALDTAPMATTDEGDALEFALSCSFSIYASVLQVAKALLPIEVAEPFNWDPAAYVASARTHSEVSLRS